MQTPWEHRYAKRTKNMQGSAIRELLKLTADPEIISFGGGLPAPEVFPVEAFQNACKTILEDPKLATLALQYSTSDGIFPLRDWIAKRASQSGLNVTADNILITSGSQQALDLIGKIFINEGDCILVEAPTYLGALQAWNAYGARYVTVPSDEYGMVTDKLEEALRAGPKFIYTLPNFQNPTGVTMTLERREKVVELADKYGVPIIEDDPYGLLRFEGEHLPSIQCLDSGCDETNGSYSG
nr:PLP-dependent aminotransferase family protein [Anaerolineaceae bacterium]